MMNAEIKKEWVAALRSGEYEQGHGRLKTSDGRFCCLGVLCDIAVKHGKGNWTPTNLFEIRSVKGCYYTKQGTLPYPLWSELNLPSDNPIVIIDGKKLELAAFNDGGTSFEVIADAIEEQL